MNKQNNYPRKRRKNMGGDGMAISLKQKKRRIYEKKKETYLVK